MMEQLTVKKLFEYCKKEIENGNGNKKIVVSDDNEGNGYHGLFFAFTEIGNNQLDDFGIYDSVETNPKKIIILG